MGNIEFIDFRFKGEDWNDVKSAMPLKQVPVLEIEGEPVLVQSIAIARMIAKEAGKHIFLQ